MTALHPQESKSNYWTCKGQGVSPTPTHNRQQMKGERREKACNAMQFDLQTGLPKDFQSVRKI